MGFIARTFIFNDIPSEFFGLELGYTGNSTEGGGEASYDASSNVSLLTQKIYRNPKPLFFGVEQLPTLQFPLTMYSTNDGIDAQSYGEISSWLFGKQSYSVLRLCQNDMIDVFANAILIDPKIEKIGNLIRSITCTVVADAPWFWKTPKTSLYSWADTQAISDTINYYNSSQNNYYTYPSDLTITANSFGGSVTLTNVSDNNRQFILTLLANEVVQINCQTQTIDSSLVTYPVQGFNMKFLRFKKGMNVLTVSGNVLSISITSEIAAKVQ